MVALPLLAMLLGLMHSSLGVSNSLLGMTYGKWGITELVEKHDMQELQETFYRKHGRSCHLMMHEMARALMDRPNAEYAALKKQCTIRCNYGCFHGLVVAQLDISFRRNNATNEMGTEIIKQELPRLCPLNDSPAVRLNCVHSIGHSLHDLIRDDLLAAKQCRVTTTSAQEAWICETGVWMSKFTFATKAYSKGAVIKECSLTPNVRACLLTAIPNNWIYEKRPALTTFSLGWRRTCAKLSQQHKEACLTSVPTLLCFDHQRNLLVERNPRLLKKDVNDLCVVGATPLETELCILGLYYCLATLSDIDFCTFVEDSQAKQYCDFLKSKSLWDLGFG